MSERMSGLSLYADARSHCCVPEKQDRLARGKLICKIERQIKWAIDAKNTRKGKSRKYSKKRKHRTTYRIRCEKPNTIKSDNGTEFRSRYMEKWSKERGITLEFTSPGKPTENGQIESFNGTMRNELIAWSRVREHA